MGIKMVILDFEKITLGEMDGVKLMNRCDRKYWFNEIHIASLLDEVKDDYYLLEIDGQRNLYYSTTYYDTPHDEMYYNHHRGKLNRYKVRRRDYHKTLCSFLEVKFKNNKGRTIKQRKPVTYSTCEFENGDSEFLEGITSYRCDDLCKVLENGFSRLTLVSKKMNERCTIDTGVSFRSNGCEAKLSDIAIVEVKTDGRSPSVIIDALNRRRIKPSGFSKYCAGRTLTNPNLKSNRFKRKERELNKKLGGL